MSLMLLWIGGITGALCRYYVVRIVQRGRFYPVGTLAVNVSGSFALGLVIAQTAQAPGSQPDPLVLLLGVGFCGAYTTFSSFAWETIELWQGQRRGYALLNLCVQPLAACLAIWFGLKVG